MTHLLFDRAGYRKYLVAEERLAFTKASFKAGGEIGTFCLTLAFTGARISEILALTPARLDKGSSIIVFESLKRRQRGIYRAVSVPQSLLLMIEDVHKLTQSNCDAMVRLWPWCRTTAWKRVKAMMTNAQVNAKLAMPRAARHAFGVDAVQNSVALNIVQKWLGHARIETTAIYADALGPKNGNWHDSRGNRSSAQYGRRVTKAVSERQSHYLATAESKISVKIDTEPRIATV